MAAGPARRVAAGLWHPSRVGCARCTAFRSGRSGGVRCGPRSRDPGRPSTAAAQVPLHRSLHDFLLRQRGIEPGGDVADARKRAGIRL